MGDKPVFVSASANPHKVEEIAVMVAHYCELLPRPSNVADVDECEETLLGNAKLKAAAVMSATGLPAMADDTGLFVDALDGSPGVRSARFAGEPSNDSANRKLLLERLQGEASRCAVFRSVMVVSWPDGTWTIAEGSVQGIITEREMGNSGFGYDQVFAPAEGDGRTYAEMSAVEKNSLSHRRRAVDALLMALISGDRTSN